MTAKVFIVVEGKSDPIQVGGTWWDIGDAASDIDGGDFWGDVRRIFPKGCVLREIRIVPDEPEIVEWAVEDEGEPDAF